MLLVGLGNPGDTYKHTRHNVGFMALDALFDAYTFSKAKQKFQGEFSEGVIDGEKQFALKPMTYMNVSGQSVQAAMQFFKLEPSDVIVIYDEIDLELGKLRVKTGGGHGGHNGLRSIDAAIGKDYKRVRIGVGHPGHKDDVSNHVLGAFSKAERQEIDTLLPFIADAFPLLLQGEDERFMTKVSQDRQPKKVEKKEESDGI